MENAVEALKIAFAVLMFVMALTLSISSFSQATQAVDAITTLRDREAQYTYVKPTDGLTRTVGIETVVTTMYRAYKENITIYFYDSHENPLTLYKTLDDAGNLQETSFLDLSNENFSSQEESVEFLNILLGGNNVSDKDELEFWDKYESRLFYPEGIYNKFAGRGFQEQLGEYDDGTGTSKITKRVITYKLQ